MSQLLLTTTPTKGTLKSNASPGENHSLPQGLPPLLGGFPLKKKPITAPHQKKHGRGFPSTSLSNPQERLAPLGQEETRLFGSCEQSPTLGEKLTGIRLVFLPKNPQISLSFRLPTPFHAPFWGRRPPAENASPRGIRFDELAPSSAPLHRPPA